MKRHWDAVVAGFGLMLGVVVMAGMILTGEYADAAGAEARGVDALFHAVADDQRDTAGMPGTLVAMNRMSQANEVAR